MSARLSQTRSVLAGALCVVGLVSCLAERASLPTEAELSPGRVTVDAVPAGTCAADLVAIGPVARTSIPVDLKYPLNLKAASITINVLSSATFLPSTLEGTTLTLGDGVGRDAYRSAVAALSDVNKDGRPDLKVTFATKELVASGALKTATSPLVLLGIAKDVGPVRGVPEGVSAPVAECRRGVELRFDYPIDVTSNEMWLDVLSSPTFNAEQININSVMLSDGAGRALFRFRAGTDDVNKDGRVDAQFSFKPKELARLGIVTSATSKVVLLAFDDAGPVWGTVPGTAQPDPTQFSLVLEPAEVTLNALGETATFKAQVLDKSGATVGGQTIAWSSEDTTVVKVDQSGKAVGAGYGTTRVTAKWLSLEAKATVTVRRLAPADNPIPFNFKLDYPIDLTEDELWVDVLSTDALDATQITAATVTLVNAAGKSVKVSRSGTDDLNKDGRTDAQFSFKVLELISKGVVTTPVDGPLFLLGYSKALGHLKGTPTPGAPKPDAFTLSVTPKTLTLKVGESAQLAGSIINRKGKTIPGLKVDWKSLNEAVLTVDATGKVTAKTVGTAQVLVSWMGLEKKVDITVKPVPAPTVEIPPQAGDFVTYPSPEWEVILGPQLRSGRPSNPWPWFDQTAITNGHHFGSRFPAVPNSTNEYILENYYDQGMVQYINYFRTGNPQFRDYARKIADSWWAHGGIQPQNGSYDNSFTPRTSSLGGLMLRALDGHPEMWPAITGYVRYQYDIWVGLRLANSELHNGVRDGGYMLLYAAWLASVHPDPTVRLEFRTKSLQGARDYYARLQYPDGSWRWRDGSGEEPGNPGGLFSQPFMVGLLLEGMISVHEHTPDPVVRTAILRAVDNLYNVAYRKDRFDLDGNGTLDGNWRGMWYFTYGTRCTPPVPGTCGEATIVRDGDTNVILEVRQLNPLTLHAFGYAYKLTGDAKYRTWGDEVFSATFGDGQGPGADGYTGLAAWGERGREYNQSYRAAGQYLAWRAGY